MTLNRNKDWRCPQYKLHRLSSVDIFAFHNMLTFLVRSQTKWCPGTNYVTLPHQKNEEEECEDTEKRHHTVEPANVRLGNPLGGVEVD